MGSVPGLAGQGAGRAAVPSRRAGLGGEGAGSGAGDGVDGVGGAGGLDDLAVGVLAEAGVSPGGEDDDAAVGPVQAGDALLDPGRLAGGDEHSVGDDDQQPG